MKEIQDSYQEIQESRDNFPDFVGIFRMQSQIFRDFSGFSRIIEDPSGLFLEILNLQNFI